MTLLKRLLLGRCLNCGGKRGCVSNCVTAVAHELTEAQHLLNQTP
jgi:hypothetical protein